MKPLELNITLRASLPHRVDISYSAGEWTCETYGREHTSLAHYISHPVGGVRRRKISKTQLTSWTAQYDVFGEDDEELVFYFYGDASAPRDEATTREYMRRLSLFGNWLLKNRFDRVYLPTIDIQTSEALHTLTDRAKRFVDCFERVFDNDWSMTTGVLNIDDEEIDCFITPGHTFLHPNVEDESNNWGNRGSLLAAYRQLKRLLESPKG